MAKKLLIDEKKSIGRIFLPDRLQNLRYKRTKNGKIAIFMILKKSSGGTKANRKKNFGIRKKYFCGNVFESK